MESTSKNRDGTQVLQGRVHLLISAFSFLIIGLIASVVLVGFIVEKSEPAAILSLLVQSIFLFGMSFIYFISRNNKNKSKLVTAMSILYILIVLANYFSVSGIGFWRLLTLLVPINAIIGAYKNQTGVPLFR